MVELIKELVSLGGTIILRHEFGTTELRGDDFIVRDTGSWLTLYHSICDSPEQRSHLHLRKESYKFAEIVENPGYTPFVAFWKSNERNEAVGEKRKPTFAIYFPSFYSWSDGNKTDIDEHQERTHEWRQQKPNEWNFQ
ncbi:MAG: hypothetical protein NE330_07590 [Lentisphaeraceae bacterium]|nr:hypothetical protein [Lentisphaeraceae bacterium]